jgi:hypothetical protein
MFAGVVAIAVVAVVIGFTQRTRHHAPGQTLGLTSNPLDAIHRGVSEQELRQLLGKPERVQGNFQGTEHCLFYGSVRPVNVPFRFCFDESGKLVAMARQ